MQGKTHGRRFAGGRGREESCGQTRETSRLFVDPVEVSRDPLPKLGQSAEGALGADHRWVWTRDSAHVVHNGCGQALGGARAMAPV